MINKKFIIKLLNSLISFCLLIKFLSGFTKKSLGKEINFGKVSKDSQIILHGKSINIYIKFMLFIIK